MCLHKNVYAASAYAACMCVSVCCLICVCVCVCFDAGIFACLSRKLCVAHKQKRKPLAARCSETLFGAADDDGSGGAGGDGAWRSMGIEVEPFARLTFFNAPLSPFYAACVASCSFCFSLRAGNNNCNMALPPLAAAAQLQQEASHEDISEIQRARQVSPVAIHNINQHKFFTIFLKFIYLKF